MTIQKMEFVILYFIALYIFIYIFFLYDFNDIKKRKDMYLKYI